MQDCGMTSVLIFVYDPSPIPIHFSAGLERSGEAERAELVFYNRGFRDVIISYFAGRIYRF